MSKKTNTSNKIFRVPEKFSGDRLDRVLQELTGLSRKKSKALLDQGRVLLNGRKVVIASWLTNAGDRIEIRPEETEAADTLPDAAKYYLKVVCEDANLLIIEKDAGIPCEPSAVSTRPSIVSIVNAYLKRKYPHLKHHYVGLVHRLDQETSGLMVYTKTKEANKITDQFKRHSIRRKYLAVVQGRIKGEGGTIQGYLKKSDLLKGGQKVSLGTAASGQLAVTHFRVMERYADATLIEVRLNTGRTHQIRVQMASIGHPVVGDRIYGERREILFPRQALHAAYLGFHHPVTGEKMEFKSELPKDMRRLVERLRLRG